MDIDRKEASRERLIFLSDAVFAIAMTLLALELIPREMPPESGLMSMLEHSVRKIFAFVLSFMVIGAQWLSHVRNMHMIRRADSTFLLLNLLLLLVVCFLPYPTAVLGEIGPNRIAVSFYAATVALLAVAGLLIWLWAAYGGRLLADGLAPAETRLIAIRHLVPIVVFGASIAIAQINPRWAMWSWIAIAPLLMLTRLLKPKTPKPA
jgi:uncharacterized membrane protein